MAEERKIVEGRTGVIASPATHKDEIFIARCIACRRLVTNELVEVMGECPDCGGHKFHGGRETWYEAIWLFFRLDRLEVKLLKRRLKKREPVAYRDA